MWQSLLSAVGVGNSPFPFEWGEIDSDYSDLGSIWTLHRGKSQTDGSPVSIFAFEFASKSAEMVEMARNAFKRLKTLRHPGVLKYIDGAEIEAKGIYIAVEPVEPLARVLSELKSRNDPSVIWGLHRLAEVLSFITNDCKLVHGNLRISSIFVSEAGDWLLGGLEYLVDHANLSYNVLKGRQMNTVHLPPEAERDDLLRGSPPHATDSWGLGVLLHEIFNGRPVESRDQLRQVSAIPHDLLPDFKKLLGQNPRQRMNPARLLQSTYFKHPVVETLSFVDNIALKDSSDRDIFFRKLPNIIDSIPQRAAVNKILPQLTHLLEIKAGGSLLLPNILKIGKLCNESQFNKWVLPGIISLFSSTERGTRVALLQSLDTFVVHLPEKIVASQIFPSIVQGFGDTSAALRDLTVKSMVSLTPKLDRKTIDTQLLRHFAKLQLDDEPTVRTNTTICLGKIACHLSQETRKKVLMPAFTRSLRDPFLGSRLAGIASINATLDYYGSAELATKAIPAMGPLCIDAESDVRVASFKLIRAILSKLENFATKSSQEPAPEPQAQGGMLSWAVTSLRSKIYGEGGEAVEKPAQVVESVQPVEPVIEPPQEPPEVEGWDVEDEIEVSPVKPPPKPSLVLSATVPEDDDWGNADWEKEEEADPFAWSANEKVEEKKPKSPEVVRSSRSLKRGGGAVRPIRGKPMRLGAKKL